MNNLVKLGIAAALAAGAIVLNIWWLNSRPKDPEFVAVNKSIEEGAEIKQEDLKPMAIPGKLEDLQKTLVRWEDRPIIFNRRAIRSFTMGDPFFQRDIQGGPPQFDVLGPFRIISVGEEYRSGEGQATDTGGGGNSNTVTVQVRHFQRGNHYEFDEKTRRLIQTIQGGEGGSTRGKQRIVTLQVYKKGTQPPDAAPADGDKFVDVHLIVPLDGVDIVKKVLAVGDDIGFVVPARL